MPKDTEVWCAHRVGEKPIEDFWANTVEEAAKYFFLQNSDDSCVVSLLDPEDSTFQDFLSLNHGIHLLHSLNEKYPDYLGPIGSCSHDKDAVRNFNNAVTEALRRYMRTVGDDEHLPKKVITQVTFKRSYLEGK